MDGIVAAMHRQCWLVTRLEGWHINLDKCWPSMSITSTGTDRIALWINDHRVTWWFDRCRWSSRRCVDGIASAG